MSRLFTTAILFAWMNTVCAFNFTGPPTNTPLNLSSSAIDIAWDGQSSSIPQVDLSWHGATADGSTNFGYTIAVNLSVTSGSFTWDPANVSNALKSTNISLSASAVYNFEAKLHNADFTSGGTVTSAEYTVTGYPMIAKSMASSFNPYVSVAAWTLVVAMLLCW